MVYFNDNCPCSISSWGIIGCKIRHYTVEHSVKHIKPINFTLNIFSIILNYRKLNAYTKK